jgi:hypothetical protein
MIFKFNPGDPEQFRQFVSPNTLRQSLGNVLNIVWMVLPAEEKGIAGCRRQIAGLFDEVIAWWRRQEVDDLERLLQRNQEGLDLAEPLTLDWARVMLRQTLTTAWSLLPEHRKQDAELERVIRLLLDELLDTMARDAHLLDHPCIDD